METKRITNDYIRDLFGLGGGAEAKKEADAILQRLHRIVFENGQDICRIDGEPDGMFFLESGEAIVLNREGEQINLMHEGQYFGEYAVLTRQKRLSTVRSNGRTVVFKMETDDVMRVLAAHPGISGELMKRLYGQVSAKHSQILELTRARRGILQDPNNRRPLGLKEMLLTYGSVAAVFLLSFFLLPKSGPAAPVFLLPLLFLIVYALLTRRTLETLILSGMFAALLLYRRELFGDYTKAVLASAASADNVFTVYVMALMGGVVTLIEASGSITAFKKHLEGRVRTGRGARLAFFVITLLTAIDDGLNLLTASVCARPAAEENRVPREETSLMAAFLPVTVCSFVPLSIWGIFVVGALKASVPTGAIGLFCRSLCFNFFSIVSVAAMLLLCFDKLPRSRQLKAAKRRVEEGGKLWPEGSEQYDPGDREKICGRVVNLLLPIGVLALASLLLGSVSAGSFAMNSAIGLTATLAVMFLLYCSQRLMSPEAFSEYLVKGMQGMLLPIVVYLLTICFSTMLNGLGLADAIDAAVPALFGRAVWLMPLVIYILATMLAAVLGSSWAMFIIAFPLAAALGGSLGMSLPLCVGAVCSAGISGEKLCPYSGEATVVGTAVGCAPAAVSGLTRRYAAAFFVLSAAFYAIAGLIDHIL